MRLPLRIALYVLVAATVLTAVLSVLDMAITREPATLSDIATDFVEMLVLSAAIVASIIVVDRLRGLEAEATTMREELSQASQAGHEWRQQSEHLF